jgi:dolichol kinase
LSKLLVGRKGVLLAVGLLCHKTDGGDRIHYAAFPIIDLGYDDNLTLPILTGALMWSWLNVASRFI